MPENAENLNELDAEMQPENIRVFNRRIHITAKYLKARLSLPDDLFDAELDAIYLETGIGPYTDGTDQWVDSFLFFDLATRPEFSVCIGDEAREAVLQLLGHYDERMPKAAA